MMIEKGLTFTGIEHRMRLSFEFDFEKLSLLKFELIHIQRTVQRLEHKLDVKALLTDSWSIIENLTM